MDATGDDWRGGCVFFKGVSSSAARRCSCTCNAVRRNSDGGQASGGKHYLYVPQALVNVSLVIGGEG